MNVLELKKVLGDLPDDMPVMYKPDGPGVIEVDTVRKTRVGWDPHYEWDDEIIPNLDKCEEMVEIRDVIMIE